MDYQEVLRSLSLELVDFIWTQVDVLTSGNIPKLFIHQLREYHVKKVMGIFPGHLEGERSFLVETEEGDVFCLLLRPIKTRWFHRHQWILYFRVIRDEELMKFFREERKMLVNISLKKLGEFHGHICPDLVLGSKACELAKGLLGKERIEKEGLVVYAQNVTSALDAIQYILGCTLGNRRLLIEDWGRHNYRFTLLASGEGVELKLKLRNIYDEEFHRLEEKVALGEAAIEDLALYQILLDEKVKMLISMDAEEIYSFFRYREPPPRIEIPTGIVSCSSCKEPVSLYACVESPEGFVCKKCFFSKHPFFEN